MKFVTLALTALLFTSLAHAADYGDLLTCKSVKGSGKFAIRQTMAVQIIQGVYTSSRNVAHIPSTFSCTKERKVTDQNLPVLWSCTSGVPGEGMFKVEVTTGGQTGLTIADISVEEMTGLVNVDTLNCQ